MLTESVGVLSTPKHPSGYGPVSLKVEFQKENESKVDERDFLMKIAIQTEEFAETCKECLVYEREIEAYSKVLPAVERCFKDLGMEVQISPRYFKVQIPFFT